ncbi:glycoside hydrolase superfamily [Aspergillus insuetus]
MSSPITIPHLFRTETSKQLIVNGRPFLMLAAELQNSSMTSAEHMSTIWQALVDANINTVLGAVPWEMIEPVEGQYNFEELDKIILDARKYNLHLVLLWFGAYKNGVSTYVPSWVKTDTGRFPRAKLRTEEGPLKTSEVLSLFGSEAVVADAKAFQALMSHIREIDEAHSTVLMVQVENEPGLIGDSRDTSDMAAQKFFEPVPTDLVEYLLNEADNLHDDFKDNLGYFFSRSPHQANTNWEAVFGQSPKTDEIFMAYHYARFVEHVAAAGRREYALPLYTNVWLNSSGDDADNGFPNVASGGGDPGNYPSGGATSCVLDIWQKFAPNLDFISPDIYLNDYAARRDEYGARRTWLALGSHAALGVSPFGIDTLTTNPYRRHYALLKQVSAIILQAQRKANTTIGFFFDDIAEDGADPSNPVVCRFGEYELTIERCFVFGKPGPACGMVIHRGDGRFLLIGWGFQVGARALAANATYTGILRVEEKFVEDPVSGTLRMGRLLNGDETRSGNFAMMPSEDPDYGGFPVAITIPAKSMIAELELYYLVENS